jgi:hypothetical protein
MASTFNSIAALVSDDTGTPEAPNGDGTQINSSFFAAIDAILNEFLTRSAKTIGGVVTWETAGSHTYSGATNGTNEVFVRNTGTNSASKTQLRLGNNADASLVTLFTSSSAAASPNLTTLETRGNLRIGVGVTASTEIYGVGGIKVRFPSNAVDVMTIAGDNISPTVTIHNTSGSGSGSNSCDRNKFRHPVKRDIPLVGDRPWGSAG